MMTVRRSSRRAHLDADACYAQQVVVWTLRAALGTNTYQLDWESPALAPAGLEQLENDRDLSNAERQPLIRKALGEAERRLEKVRGNGEAMLANVELLGEPLGLEREEREVLALAVATALNPQLAACFETQDGRSQRRRIQIIAYVLGLDDRQVTKAVRPEGALARLGLLRLHGPGSNYGWFWLRYGLDEVLAREHTGSRELLDTFAPLASPAELTLADYPHLERDLQLVLRSLRGAVQQKARGFHLLLHGEPGTGKTQLTRALAAEIGCPLLEVGVEDDDHDPLSRAGRLSNYWVCQHYGARLPAALVAFDEMEDAFEPEVVRSALFGPESRYRKGFTNRMLEEAPIPTLWCSNDVSVLDPAYLRRFDLVLEVRAPPKEVRRRMLEKHLRELKIGGELAERLASSEATPADCERASRVVHLAGLTQPQEIEPALERVMELRLQALGKRPSRRQRPATGAYSLRHLNLDLDPAGLIAGLKARGQGTVLFHGPPGTGKTALAAHIAEELGRPLLVRCGSDILGAYVGETEKALASMFAEARAQQAVLFLDEADSFLGAREGAHYRWEISQTNELLVRMEQLDGIFLCATNRLEALDPACLRRFAIKVGFRPLTEAQAWELFGATLAAAGQPALEGEEARRTARTLARLGALTPGDFAAASKRATILGARLTAEALLHGLEEEAARRPCKQIGF